MISRKLFNLIQWKRIWPVLCLLLGGQYWNFPMPESNGLSGTFGELRDNHLHSGFDIKTFERIGIPVRAAQDGYVSRIFVASYGYGKALYIRHAGGYSTVYGHLDEFAPAIDQKVRSSQRANKQFEIQLFPKLNEFPIKKGDIIAYSGNSGYSAGPHLHYEIRDENENIINPFLYHANYFQDIIPPTINRIAIQPLTAYSRVNGDPDKILFYPNQSEHNYSIPEVVSVYGPVGIEFSGYDIINGSRNTNAIYQALLYLDDSLVYQYSMDKYSWNDMRYVNIHIDYRFYREKDGRLQRCYVERGNQLPIYRNLFNNGRIHIQDNLVHTVKLILYDYAGNKALFTCALARSDEPPLKSSGISAYQYSEPTAFVRENYIIVNQPIGKIGDIVASYKDGTRKFFFPTVHLPNRSVTVIPILNKQLPNRLASVAWKNDIIFWGQSLILPTQRSTVRYGDNLVADFPVAAVFDTTYLTISERAPVEKQYGSNIFTIGDLRQPVFKKFTLKLLPNQNGKRFPPNKLTIFRRKTDGSLDYVDYTYRHGNEYFAPCKDFGDYFLLVDTIPPTIYPLTINNGSKITQGQKIKFKIEDSLSEVNLYKNGITLDNNWMLAEYNEYDGIMTWRIKEPIAPGKHTLLVWAEDNCGNFTRKTYTVYSE